VQIEKKLPNIL